MSGLRSKVGEKIAGGKQVVKDVREFRSEWAECEAATRTQRALAISTPDVQEVQLFAMECGVRLRRTGVLDALTVRFVRTFQATYQLDGFADTPLVADGIPGVKTMFAMAHCRSNGHRVSKNFGYREFVDLDGGVLDEWNPGLRLDRDLVRGLQYMRDVLGPCKIVSGYRGKRRNLLVKGAKNSQHMLGKAADVQFSKTPLTRHAEAAGFNGIGTCRSNGRVVHVDVRGWRARWGYSC